MISDKSFLPANNNLVTIEEKPSYTQQLAITLMHSSEQNYENLSQEERKICNQICLMYNNPKKYSNLLSKITFEEYTAIQNKLIKVNDKSDNKKTKLGLCNKLSVLIQELFGKHISTSTLKNNILKNQMNIALAHEKLYLDTYFITHAANTSSFNDAKLILLGDNHIDPVHQKIPVFLYQFGQKKNSQPSLILCEGTPEYENNQIASTNFMTKSWETKNFHKHTKYIDKNAKLVQLITEKNQETQTAYNLFQEKSKLYLELCDTIFADPQEQKQALSEQTKAKEHLQTLYKEQDDLIEKWKKITEKMTIAKEKRDEDICNAIKRHVNDKTYDKIFVFAGSAHINKNTQLPQLLSSYKDISYLALEMKLSPEGEKAQKIWANVIANNSCIDSKTFFKITDEIVNHFDDEKK